MYLSYLFPHKGTSLKLLEEVFIAKNLNNRYGREKKPAKRFKTSNVVLDQISGHRHGTKYQTFSAFYQVQKAKP